MTLKREDITGLLLAGGRATRMGGQDKGLLSCAGRTLAAWTVARLAPQVGALAINANRHLDTYAALGHPVWPDALADFPGPLAGMLAGLQRCTTPWLATVPCDTPLFPADLVARLAEAAQAQGADVVIAATREDGALQPQPVFCLMARTLAPALEAFLAGGQRKIDRFTGAQRQAVVEFDDAQAFFNANTPDELARLAQALAASGHTAPASAGRSRP